MRQSLINKDFRIHFSSLQSFCIGKSFIPQDIGPCALYYYDVDESAHLSFRSRAFGDDAQVGGKPSNDFASSGE